MTTAVVFPGQGSQRPQMATPWRDTPGFARWAEADDVLSTDVTRLGLDADADELQRPANCQVALFVHGVVVLEAWREATGGKAAYTAGHSLGEYDALVAASVLEFADGLRLVHARARHTQEAADARPGTMVACLGYEVDDVGRACEEAGTHLANDNAPGQVVAAGSVEALKRLKELLGDLPGRGKVVDVAVGAAYHSPHMQPAVEPFTEAVAAVVFGDAHIPVVANVDAGVHRGAGDWPELLTRQIVTPVRWRESVGTLEAEGVTDVVELCAAPVLTGLVKRTARGLGRHAVTAPEDLASDGLRSVS
jgi:[acyl-carrier-protein] S-malonyltransferase